MLCLRAPDIAAATTRVVWQLQPGATLLQTYYSNYNIISLHVDLVTRLVTVLLPSHLLYLLL
jgi:hypothetical protein